MKSSWQISPESLDVDLEAIQAKITIEEAKTRQEPKLMQGQFERKEPTCR